MFCTKLDPEWRPVMEQAFAEGMNSQGNNCPGLRPAPSTDLSPEETEALFSAIDDLPAKAKMALLLYRQDGLTYAQIGARLKVETDQARLLVFRAFEYLLEKVGEVAAKQRPSS